MKIVATYKFEDKNELAIALYRKRVNYNGPHLKVNPKPNMNVEIVLSRAQAARILGISKAEYTDYENANLNVLKMNDDLFYRMCDFLEIDIKK